MLFLSEDLITVEVLKEALRNVFHEKEPVEDEWIESIAQFIMDFFGYETRILDNDLTSKDRDIFYMLEGLGVLKTEMEEATIQKGKVWRIHYWILNNQRIVELSQDKGTKCYDEKCEDDLYNSLSEKIWSRKE